MITNTIKTVVLLGFLAGLFIGVGGLMGGKTGMIIGFSIAMLMNLGSFWFSDKIVLAMYKAKEVSKGHRLYKIVEELSRKANLPMPKVYTIQAPSPNAFATGRSPKNAAVASTESLLNLLNEEEVKAVMAHELSHIKNRDTLVQTIAVGIASAIAMIAEMAQWAMIFGFGGNDDDNSLPGMVGIIVLAILTPIIATLIQLAISRQREYMADEGATKIMKTPEYLISALKKLESGVMPSHHSNVSSAPTESLFIVNPFKGNSFFKLFSTHPSTEDRIKAMRKIKL